MMDADEVRRALVRIAHEIAERNRGVHKLALVGIHTRGVPLAKRIAAELQSFEGVDVPVASLDIGLYRDDLLSGAPRDGGSTKPRSIQPSEMPSDITGRVVVLVDDVLYTGRSVRAALDALMDVGRPRAIQLAVMIDRGHRELPVRADYVGKNIPTALDERVQLRLSDIDGEDAVVLLAGE